MTSNGKAGMFSEVVTNKRLEKPIAKCGNRTTDGMPTLKWNDVGAEYYEVYRATSKSGTYTKKFTTEGLTYTNTSAVVGETYYYKVKAIYTNGKEVYSAVYINTATCGVPKIEKGNRSDGIPTLKWEDVKGAAKYEVYRSDDGKNYVKAFTTTGNTYSNTGAKAGITYYYKVRGVTSNGKAGMFSSIVSNRLV